MLKKFHKHNTVYKCDGIFNDYLIAATLYIIECSPKSTAVDRQP